MTTLTPWTLRCVLGPTQPAPPLPRPGGHSRSRAAARTSDKRTHISTSPRPGARTLLSQILGVKRQLDDLLFNNTTNAKTVFVVRNPRTSTGA